MGDSPDQTCWIEISAVVDSAVADELEQALDEAGALAVSAAAGADEEIFETDPGALARWQSVSVTGLFDNDTDPIAIIAALAVALPRLDLGVLRTGRIENRDWERVWLDHFAPIKIGANLWISPRGQSAGSDSAPVVYIDPGLAFGTGNHASTRLCLARLSDQPPTDQDVLDYGCGSGILGIAALKLGARRVQGVDIDPRSITASIDNAGYNDVAGNYCCELESDFRVSRRFDLVIANILAETLTGLAARLSACLRPGGVVMLAGVLEHQADQVSAAYREFSDWQRHHDGEWTLLFAHRHR